jgi:hypothetical protein
LGIRLLKYQKAITTIKNVSSSIGLLQLKLNRNREKEGRNQARKKYDQTGPRTQDSTVEAADANHWTTTPLDGGSVILKTYTAC